MKQKLGNTKTIGTYHPFQQLMVSFFQTVTMRTAGFATISYQDAHPATNILYMLQMIIGDAPGGTAGGVKVTTIAITYLLFKSELDGQSEVTFRNRICANKTIKQTLTVLIFFFAVLMTGYVLLLEVEPSIKPLALLFEAISAIATVGVSMDVTPQLSTSWRTFDYHCFDVYRTRRTNHRTASAFFKKKGENHSICANGYHCWIKTRKGTNYD